MPSSLRASTETYVIQLYGDSFTSSYTRVRASVGTPRSPPLPKVDAEWLFWEMMRISRTPDPYMFPALKKLRASGKYFIGALSNTVKFPDEHPYSKDASGVRSQFDFFISSAHTGLRKPDPKIYEVAIQEMNVLAKQRGVGPVQPSDIVFFDDIGENLKAGKNAGLRTVKVTLGRTQDAVKELEKITGLDLLEGKDESQAMRRGTYAEGQTFRDSRDFISIEHN
jgi:haloacid dehalogenase superfamily, subfamily IA, variant 3 with third motif having DD or ED